MSDTRSLNHNVGQETERGGVGKGRVIALGAQVLGAEEAAIRENGRKMPCSFEVPMVPLPQTTSTIVSPKNYTRPQAKQRPLQ